MKRLEVTAALVLACVLTGPAASQAQSPMGAFCGTRPSHRGAYAHVVWVWMENHGYNEIIGSPAAPFINALAANCGLATNFHNTTHFSLPNYLGAVTGLPLGQLQTFLLDCNPGGACLTPATSIFAQVPSWKAYEESMPSNCAPTGVSPYGVRHNPPVYLSSLTGCSTFDVPYTALQVDLDNDTLPAFSFVTPNNVHNMHDGADPGAIQNGDGWLATELPKILNSAAYQSGNTVVFLTWDEGEVGPDFTIGEDCAQNTTGASCHIPTIVISPTTPAGVTSDKLFNHYSMLKTTEQLLRILGRGKYLGLARKARSMRRPFKL
jgi:hypothetical protein